MVNVLLFSQRDGKLNSSPVIRCSDLGPCAFTERIGVDDFYRLPPFNETVCLTL